MHNSHQSHFHNTENNKKRITKYYVAIMAHQFVNNVHRK